MSHPDVSEDEQERWIAGARASFEKLRVEFETRWKRSLPFEEMLFDRWERAKTLGFGEKTSIHHNSYVYGNVTVGENTWIGPFTLLDGSGGLSIGGACSISAGVQIYSHDTVRWALSGGKLPYEYAPVTIGDACHIGAQAIITKGVTIGAHSVVGSNAFVNRDLPPFTIAFGTPAVPCGRVVLGEDGSVQLEFDRKSPR